MGDINQSGTARYKAALADFAANDEQLRNNILFNLTQQIKGEDNPIIKAKLKLQLANILLKRLNEIRQWFTKNNINSVSDFTDEPYGPGLQNNFEQWLKNKDWWIPRRPYLDDYEETAWADLVNDVYGELYYYLGPQSLLNSVHILRNDAMKTLIMNSGLGEEAATAVYQNWKESNPRPIFIFPPISQQEQQRRERAIAAERRRAPVDEFAGGRRKRKTRKTRNSRIN